VLIDPLWKERFEELEEEWWAGDAYKVIDPQVGELFPKSDAPTVQSQLVIVQHLEPTRKLF